MLAVLNGNFIDLKSPVFTIESRLAKYGDGFFESILYQNGIALWNLHWERILHCCTILQFTLTSNFSSDFLYKKIQELLIQNNLQNEKCRIRISFFRNDIGLYLPISNEMNYTIECKIFESKIPTNQSLTIYYDNVKACTNLSNIKSNNAIINILASKYAVDNGFDDAVLLNSNRNIAECIASNIFIIKNEIIYTPSLSEACVAGVQRTNIILKNNIIEKAISIDELLDADAIFKSSATKGFSYFSKLEEREFNPIFNLNIQL